MTNSKHHRISSQGRDGLPETLKHQDSPQQAFGEAVDPFARIQREAMLKKESQRRGEQDKGSLMIKTDKPFPELKPRHAQAVLRQYFNRRWDAEVKRARNQSPDTRPTPDVFERVKAKRRNDRTQHPKLGR